MPVQLNHTIVRSHDKQESATFASEVLGLPAPAPFGPFLVVEAANGVSLDYIEEHGEFQPQHYAFLVTEEEFDQIYERIKARGVAYWADPLHHRPDLINTNDGGRGLYWADPDGHNLEIITRPYGG